MREKEKEGKGKWCLTYSNIVHPDPKDSPSPRRRCGWPTYIFSPRNARATWRRCSWPGWASSRSWWWRQGRMKRGRRRRRTRRIQSRRCDPRNPSGRRIASRPECIWSHRIGTRWCILCVQHVHQETGNKYHFFSLTYNAPWLSLNFFFPLFLYILSSVLSFHFLVKIFKLHHEWEKEKKRKRKVKWIMGLAFIVDPLYYCITFDYFRTFLPLDN